MFHLEKTQPSFNIFLHRKMRSDIIDFAIGNEHEKDMIRIYLIKFSPIMAWSFI